MLRYFVSPKSDWRESGGTAFGELIASTTPILGRLRPARNVSLVALANCCRLFLLIQIP